MRRVVTNNGRSWRCRRVNLEISYG
jgi:hypothetical protein